MTWRILIGSTYPSSNKYSGTMQIPCCSKMLYLALFLQAIVFINTTSGSFINRSEFNSIFDPDDQLEYLTNYLEDYAAMISTVNTRCDLYDNAVHDFQRGLKESFLAEFKKVERLAASVLSYSGTEIAGESAFQDIMTRFQECAHRAIPAESDQQTSSRSRRRRHTNHSHSKSRSRILECAESAEQEITEAVADSFGAMADADGTKEADRLAGFGEGNVKRLERIVRVERGEVIRWPWLTDEGWTWPWIIGAVILIVLAMCILAGIGWMVYDRLYSSQDSWGQDVEEEV